MNEAVAGSSHRSGALAVVLAFFLPLVAFAYVRRPGWGIAYVLLGPALMFAAGRLGLITTAMGYWTLLVAVYAIMLIGLVLAYRFARAMPEGAPLRWYNRWYHYIWLALVGVAISYSMATHRGALFGFEPFRIPSTSMQPALVPGDFIVVDERASAMADIERGDIVIYMPRRYPEQAWTARVIGLPGETIVAKHHLVDIDGVRLQEPYLAHSREAADYPATFERVALGAEEYFLMGDNRPNAEDSRFQGPVARSAIRGKVRAIWLSYSPFTHSIDTSRIGTLPAAYGK